VTVATNFDEALAWADVVGLLRLQVERGSGSFVPTLREFTTTYGLTIERARSLRPETIIMHPGPINRGVEIDSSVADLPSAVIDRQVTNGRAGTDGRVVLERGRRKKGETVKIVVRGGLIVGENSNEIATSSSKTDGFAT